MYNFLKWTAVKMTPVTPYGIFHLTFFIIGLSLSIFLALKLKKISLKKLNWILFWLGIFLVITELYKQLFYTYYIGKGDYQEWIFPFQLCSIPMYLCLLLPFIKNKKIYNAIMAFLVSYNLLGGFVAFIEPSGLIHEYYTLTYHAFIWHMMVTFIGLLVGFNIHIKYSLKEFKDNVLIFLGLCTTAFIINIIIGNGINMFFVGPQNSPIIVFSSISKKLGWFINDLIYIPAMTFGAFLVYYPFTKIKK